jgi:putative two-component system response regulator
MYALILDDDEINCVLVTEAIRSIPDCTPRSFCVPEQAVSFVRQHADEIGIAITDYDMPGMNGIAFIQAARLVSGFAHVPIVMITSNDQRSLKREALEAGATDFLSKPFDVAEVKARVSNLMRLSEARRIEADRAAWLDREVAAAVAVIEAREREIVTRLTRAAEYRDTDTGDHVARVASYVGLIASSLGLDERRCQMLSLASTMHDVGKIAVPDAILLKQGPLTADERAIMERHAERGYRMLEGSSSDLVQLAAEIALNHHERWDGAGYPNRRLDKDIPLSGRIVAVADVFDALTSERPYKKAWPLDKAKEYVLSQSGSQFDPACVDAFLLAWDAIAGVAAAQNKLAEVA